MRDLCWLLAILGTLFLAVSDMVEVYEWHYLEILAPVTIMILYELTLAVVNQALTNYRKRSWKRRRKTWKDPIEDPSLVVREAFDDINEERMRKWADGGSTKQLPTRD